MQTIHSTTYSGGGVEKRVVEIKCLTCDGTGNATPEQLAKLQAMNDAWCKCGNPSGEPVPYRYADGSHGYNCADCGGLLQTG
jgi:hypothetical protein